jgi:Gpi18-like mannosyltransferase
MRISKTSKYLAVFLIGAVGLALRIYLLFKPGFTNDISLFLSWGERIANEGLASVFSTSAYSQGIDYPFLVPYLVSLFVKLTVGMSEEVKTVLFKLPATFFEIALVVASGIVVLKSEARYKWTLFALVIIQPALALVSSAWGQIDAIFCSLLLLGFLANEKYEYLSPILIFVAILIKPQAMFGVGIYFIYLIGQRDWKKLLRQAAVFAALFVLLLGSFKIFSHINLFEPYTKSVGRYDNLSLNAFNMWWFIFGKGAWNVKDTVTAVLSYRKEGMLLFGIFAIPAIVYLLSRKRKVAEALLALSYIYLIFFIFPTEIHERYMYPAVAFMGIPAILNWRIFFVYSMLSITFFANIFAVLQTVYPQFGFLTFDLLSGDWTRVVAFVNLITAIYVMIFIANAARGWNPRLTANKSEKSKEESEK